MGDVLLVHLERREPGVAKVAAVSRARTRVRAAPRHPADHDSGGNKEAERAYRADPARIVVGRPAVVPPAVYRPAPIAPTGAEPAALAVNAVAGPGARESGSLSVRALAAPGRRAVGLAPRVGRPPSSLGIPPFVLVRLGGDRRAQDDRSAEKADGHRPIPQ